LGKSILTYGFKSKAERMALEYRQRLNINAYDPLCAFKLAENLQVPIFRADELVTHTKEIELLKGINGKGCSWSALTMVTKIGNRIIIHNSFHSPARQQSDIMHELAHIICDHKHNQQDYDFEVPFGMLEYNELQEEEAKCLGSILQLPSPCLLWAKNKNLTIEEMATHFNASKEMVNYRMNTSGVAKRYLLNSRIA
jgi:Zn-dependent peptidase ImmA (M78 family)